MQKQNPCNILAAIEYIAGEKLLTGLIMEDIEICHCNEVMKSEIVKAIREKHLQTVEEVQDATQAGTVCGGCIPDIEEILNEISK